VKFKTKEEEPDEEVCNAWPMDTIILRTLRSMLTSVATGSVMHKLLSMPLKEFQ